MKRRSPAELPGLWRVVWLVCLAAALLVASALQHSLNRERARLELTRLAPLTNAPPMLAFTTVALGGFRGLIANVLWIRSAELQERGQYFEALQLADWITRLQPHHPTVWRFHAWNLAYNIGGSFPQAEDRWRWVQRGLRLLRDEALRYNPDSIEIHTELATFYQHKLGLDLDPAHRFYKESLAAEMVAVLGRSPDFAALQDPRTDEEHERSRRLREELRLDPTVMAAVNDRYGPLDWRLPEAHAIYWAHLGMQRARDSAVLPLRRVIWQSLLGAMRHGRLIENPAELSLDYGPNLDILDTLHDFLESSMEDEPARREYIGRAHRSFHQEVVVLLYTHNRIAEAAQWFNNLREEYPDAVPPGRDLHDFVIDQVGQLARGSSADRVRGALEGLLITGYLNYALGEDDAAVGHVLLARRIWARHQERFAGQHDRAGLPPFETLQQTVIQRILDGQTRISPALAEILRRRAGLATPPGP